MLDPLTVAEAVRPLFPCGAVLLQHMVSQSVNAVPTLSNNILHGATIPVIWLLSTMVEEAMCPEHRKLVIVDLEAAFREAASGLGLRTLE